MSSTEPQDNEYKRKKLKKVTQKNLKREAFIRHTNV